MWKPIAREEFEVLYAHQLTQLSADAKACLDRFAVPIQTAQIVRSRATGEEAVFVIARCPGGVLYFDDVEYGFNVSPVDSETLITDPGGSQYTLAEAVERWLLGAAGEPGRD